MKGKKKILISIPFDLFQEANQEAENQLMTFSIFVAQALKLKLSNQASVVSFPPVREVVTEKPKPVIESEDDEDDEDEETETEKEKQKRKHDERYEKMKNRICVKEGCDEPQCPEAGDVNHPFCQKHIDQWKAKQAVFR